MSHTLSSLPASVVVAKEFYYISQHTPLPKFPRQVGRLFPRGISGQAWRAPRSARSRESSLRASLIHSYFRQQRKVECPGSLTPISNNRWILAKVEVPYILFSLQNNHNQFNISYYFTLKGLHERTFIQAIYLFTCLCWSIYLAIDLFSHSFIYSFIELLIT